MALLAVFAGGAGAADGTAEELQRELKKQQELLDQMERGELRAPPPQRAVESNEDPRAATPAPVIRDLPIAIFDEKAVKIPRGRWGNRGVLSLLRRSLDADQDGKPELLRFVDPESSLLIRQEEDRNYDGVLDAFSDYEYGELVRRAIDDNDDGKLDAWEQYAKRRLIRREVDRDRDGVRDAFFEYDGRALLVERHDSNNDGKINREIRYRDRKRVTSTEDEDSDGRTDIWFEYAEVGGREVVTRIKRDKQKRGKPDVFESFETAGGKAVLKLREEDVDGDGEIDILSIYRGGKLVRRELAKAELRPL